MSGRIQRVVVETERNGTMSLVVKQASASEVERELLFRSRCGELLRGSIPDLFGGWSDAETDCGVLLLEDVTPAEQGDVLRGCSAENAAAVVRSLARVHGATWKTSLAAFADDLPRWGPRGMDVETWVARLARAGERFPEILTHRRRARLHDLPERIATVVAPLRAGPASWIQVDAHLDNVLWRPDGTAVLLDWCSASVGSPAVDLLRSFVEGMATSTTSSALLSAYSQELRQYGVTGAEPVELRAAMGLALPPLVQGVVGWAGREDLPRHGRPRLLCENILRSVADWSDAEDAGL